MVEQGVLGMDHRTTHGIASRYEAFAPEVALALATPWVIHDTPKHGRWLHRAATARRVVVARQGLERRMDDRDLLARAIAAGQADRQRPNARLKLPRLYPSFDM